MKKLLVIFGIALAGPSVGFGTAFPPTGTWTSYTNADDVYALSPASVGITVIWAGTTGGVLNGDAGRVFTKYTNAEGLPGNDVRAIATSPSELWFGLYGDGLSRYSPGSSTWRQYTTYDGLEDNRVLSVLVDGNIVWVGMEPGLGKKGFVRFDDAGTPDNRQDDDWTPFDSLADKSVQALGLQGNTLWIAIVGGLYSVSRGTSYPYLTNWQRHFWGSNVTGLAFEPGAVWASTYGGGIYRWDGAGWTQMNNGLPSLNVNALALSGGQFWAATDGGMALYDAPNSRWLVHNEGLSRLTMREVAIDISGRAWAGGSQSGLWAWDGVQWQKTFLNQIAYDWSDHLHLGPNSEVLVSHGNKGVGASLLSQGQWDTLRIPLARDTSNWVAGVLVTGDGLWLGSWGAGLFWRKPNGTWTRFTPENTNRGLLTPHIAEMTQDPQGNLYIGCWWDGVSVLSANRSSWTNYYYSGIPRMPFRSMLLDQRGRLWCGFDDQGLLVYDQGAWTYYYPGSDPPIRSSHVSDIAEDDSGNIWIATWGGVSYFDGRSFTTYTRDGTSGGLPSDMAEAVAIDSQGWIWFGTNAGIAVYDPQRKRWANFVQGAKGLVGNNVRKIRIRPDPQDPHRDQIWIGTTNGLSLFVPDNASPADLISVNVFPNPYRPNTGVVTFQGLPDGAEIWIYTTSGDLVKRLSSPDPHRHSLTWDGRNVSGHGVSSGFFPYVVKGAGQTRGGTLAILR